MRCLALSELHDSRCQAGACCPVARAATLTGKITIRDKAARSILTATDCHTMQVKP
jgi:hypothetical protein